MHPIIRKIPGLFFLLAVVFMAVLNTGTVRRKQSSVSKTQTAGIKLKDKLEELKDGEKGPATPSFGWYGGKNGFMSDPPFSKGKLSKADEPAVIPVVSEVELPPSGSAVDQADDEQEAEGWDEDWADEGVKKEDEALPPKDDTEKDVDQPDSPKNSDTSKDKKSSKWDKDWWDEI